MNEAELIAEIERFDQDGFLSSDKNTLEVVSFIKNPPLPRSARLVYSLLFKAAVLTIEPKYLERLGLKQGTRWLIQPATRGLLRFMRFAIGPDSPGCRSAFRRRRIRPSSVQQIQCRPATSGTRYKQASSPLAHSRSRAGTIIHQFRSDHRAKQGRFNP